MSDAEFNELAGRIEGMSRSYLMLAAHLNRMDALNGERLADGLMDASRKIDFPGEHLPAAQRTMRELSAALEELCNLRPLQESGDQA